MSTFKDRGIVLKETDAGESGKRLTLLLKDSGKVTVSARGARNSKSKFGPASQPFAYCDYVFFRGGGFLSVTQADVIENFYGIRDNFDSYCYGCFFLEMADKLILEQMPSEKVLFLLIKSLLALTKGAQPPSLVSVIYQLKFLQFEGLAPVVPECSVCGGSAAYFSGDGAVCGACLAQDAKKVRVSAGALDVMQYILLSETKDLFGFSVPNSVLAELERAIAIFRQMNIEYYFKSLELML